MEYLVTMTTHVPDGTSQQAVEAVRVREAARSRELAEQGRRRPAARSQRVRRRPALVFDDRHLAGIVSPADISRALERLTRSPGGPGSPRR